MKKETRGRKPYRKISDYVKETKELKEEREALKAKMERLYLAKFILETCLQKKRRTRGGRDEEKA